MNSWQQAFIKCDSLRKIKGDYGEEIVNEKSVDLLNAIFITLEKTGVSAPDLIYWHDDGSIWAEWVKNNRKIVSVSQKCKISFVNW